MDFGMNHFLRLMDGWFGSETHSKNEISWRKHTSQYERYKDKNYLKLLKLRLIQRKKDWVIRKSREADEAKNPTRLDRGYAMALSLSSNPEACAKVGIRLIDDENSEEAKKLFAMVEASK